MVAQVGYSVVGRLRGRVTLCVICTIHVEMRSVSFLVDPQNQGRRFISGLVSKPLGRVSLVWPQNWWRRFSPVWPQNRWLGFPSLGPKPAATVWWFGPQNYRDGFLVWASKPSSLRFVGCAIKSTEGGWHGTQVEIWQIASSVNKSH
jgi:hypothetical protein